MLCLSGHSWKLNVTSQQLFAYFILILLNNHKNLLNLNIHVLLSERSGRMQRLDESKPNAWSFWIFFFFLVGFPFTFKYIIHHEPCGGFPLHAHWGLSLFETDTAEIALI